MQVRFTAYRLPPTAYRLLIYFRLGMFEIPLALTYDDVLLVPRRSSIASRRDVDTSSRLTRKLTLGVPIVSANMDTVTDARLAVALAHEGGIGIIHRFMTIEEEAAEVARVKRP